MPHRKHPKHMLEQAGENVRLKLADDQHQVSIDFSLLESRDFLMNFGFLMNLTLAKKLGRVEPPAETLNVINPTAYDLAVTTVEGKTYLTIGCSDFPDIRLEIPDERLKAAGEALLRISKTPKDLRTQKLN